MRKIQKKIYHFCAKLKDSSLTKYRNFRKNDIAIILGSLSSLCMFRRERQSTFWVKNSSNTYVTFSFLSFSHLYGEYHCIQVVHWILHNQPSVNRFEPLTKRQYASIDDDLDTGTNFYISHVLFNCLLDRCTDGSNNRVAKLASENRSNRCCLCPLIDSPFTHLLSSNFVR